jgi:hypothetical protein
MADRRSLRCLNYHPNDTRQSKPRRKKIFPGLQNDPLNDSLIHVDFVRALNIALRITGFDGECARFDGPAFGGGTPIGE